MLSTEGHNISISVILNPDATCNPEDDTQKLSPKQEVSFGVDRPYKCLHAETCMLHKVVGTGTQSFVLLHKFRLQYTTLVELDHCEYWSFHMSLRLLTFVIRSPHSHHLAIDLGHRQRMCLHGVDKKGQEAAGLETSETLPQVDVHLWV